MKKALSIIAFIAITLSTYAQELQLSPKEAISLLKQPFTKTKALINKKGYEYTGKDDQFYTFRKGYYEISVGLKNSTVSIISVKESVFSYKLLLLELSAAGCLFTKASDPRYTEAPYEALPSTILRFDKNTTASCFIVSPYNLYQSAEKAITVNYGIYSK